VVLGAVFLMPAITSLVASVFVDEVATMSSVSIIRRSAPAPRCRSVWHDEGVKTALLTIWSI